MFCENHTGPAAGLLSFFTDDIDQGVHPSFFLFGAVGIEIDGFAIGKADAETFLDEHVAFFLSSEGRSTTSTSFASDFFLCER